EDFTGINQIQTNALNCNSDLNKILEGTNVNLDYGNTVELTPASYQFNANDLADNSSFSISGVLLNGQNVQYNFQTEATSDNANLIEVQEQFDAESLRKALSQVTLDPALQFSVVNKDLIIQGEGDSGTIRFNKKNSIPLTVKNTQFYTFREDELARLDTFTLTNQRDSYTFVHEKSGRPAAGVVEIRVRGEAFTLDNIKEAIADFKELPFELIFASATLTFFINNNFSSQINWFAQFSNGSYEFTQENQIYHELSLASLNDIEEFTVETNNIQYQFIIATNDENVIKLNNMTPTEIKSAFEKAYASSAKLTFSIANDALKVETVEKGINSLYPTYNKWEIKFENKQKSDPFLSASGDLNQNDSLNLTEFPSELALADIKIASYFANQASGATWGLVNSSATNPALKIFGEETSGGDSSEVQWLAGDLTSVIVKATYPGTALLIAKTDTCSASRLITVLAPDWQIEDLAGNPLVNTASLNVGENQGLKVVDKNGEEITTLSWNSSNPSSIAVDEQGIVTAVKLGQAYIWASGSQGEMSNRILFTSENKFKINGRSADYALNHPIGTEISFNPTWDDQLITGNLSYQSTLVLQKVGNVFKITPNTAGTYPIQFDYAKDNVTYTVKVNLIVVESELGEMKITKTPDGPNYAEQILDFNLQVFLKNGTDFNSNENFAYFQDHLLRWEGSAGLQAINNQGKFLATKSGRHFITATINHQGTDYSVTEEVYILPSFSINGLTNLDFSAPVQTALALVPTYQGKKITPIPGDDPELSTNVVKWVIKTQPAGAGLVTQTLPKDGSNTYEFFPPVTGIYEIEVQYAKTNDAGDEIYEFSLPIKITVVEIGIKQIAINVDPEITEAAPFKVGENRELSVKIKDNNGTEISDEAYLQSHNLSFSIDEGGVLALHNNMIQSLTAGTAFVTASLDFNGTQIKKTKMIDVSPGFTVNGSNSLELSVPTQIPLNLIAQDDNAPSNANWQVLEQPHGGNLTPESNESIYTQIPMANGDYRLKAVNNKGKEISILIHAVPAAITSMGISASCTPPSATFPEIALTSGKTTQLYLIINSICQNNLAINWDSSSSLLQVENSGLVRGLQEGLGIVNAQTSLNGNTLNVSIPVRVNPGFIVEGQSQDFSLRLPISNKAQTLTAKYFNGNTYNDAVTTQWRVKENPSNLVNFSNKTGESY
ncbi:MAG TPA: hypothetical protein PLQ36_01500, partial [Candidatus Gracilibacteria bacterium]|nr:hypothetical protein [Candidatus Gracilibacteria bacterium]